MQDAPTPTRIDPAAVVWLVVDANGKEQPPDSPAWRDWQEVWDALCRAWSRQNPTEEPES